MLVKERNITIDSIKGLAILGVVLAHMQFKSRFCQETLDYLLFFHKIFIWCVLAFFFASGFFQKKIGTSLGLRDYLLLKGKRLLVPAVSFSLLYKCLILLLMVFREINSVLAVPSTPLEMVKFLFFPAPPQFYFLYYLFFILLGHFALQIWFSDLTIFLISVVGYLVGVHALGTPNYLFGDFTSNIPSYFVQVSLGFVIASDESIFRKKLYLVSFVLVLCIQCFSYAQVAYLIMIVPVFLYYSLSKLKMSKYLKTFNFLGKHSSSIFVWHTPIVSPILNIILSKLFTSPFITVPLTIGGAVFVSLALAKLCQKNKFLVLWRI